MPGLSEILNCKVMTLKPKQSGQYNDIEHLPHLCFFIDCCQSDGRLHLNSTSPRTVRTGCICGEHASADTHGTKNHLREFGYV